MCPANITIAAGAEETNVSWSEPEFSESLGFQLNVTSTFGNNTVSLGWGEHRVEYTAINIYNNMVTTCVFYVDVKRKSELTHYSTECLPFVDIVWNLVALRLSKIKICSRPCDLKCSFRNNIKMNNILHKWLTYLFPNLFGLLAYD